MKKYLIALHSEFDGVGESVRLVIVEASDKKQALFLALQQDGWQASSDEDLKTISDLAWSESYEISGGN